MAKPTLVKCKYCHKEIDKSLAYNPEPRSYYCNEDHYIKHQKKKDNYANYIKKKYDVKEVDDVELTNTINYVKEKIGDINKVMVKKQIIKLIESGYTYKGIELTIDYAINILSLQLDPIYGISYIVEKYYNNAKKYWIKKERIKKDIRNTKISDKTKVVIVQDRNDRLKDKLKVEEF